MAAETLRSPHHLLRHPATPPHPRPPPPPPPPRAKTNISIDSDEQHHSLHCSTLRYSLPAGLSELETRGTTECQALASKTAVSKQSCAISNVPNCDFVTSLHIGTTMTSSSTSGQEEQRRASFQHMVPIENLNLLQYRQQNACKSCS